MTSAAIHYEQVALDAQLAKDHPLDDRGLPAFTSYEALFLRLIYPSLLDSATRCVRDHRDMEQSGRQERSGLPRGAHVPSEWHPCPMCRAEANPMAEFIGPQPTTRNNP